MVKSENPERTFTSWDCGFRSHFSNWVSLVSVPRNSTLGRFITRRLKTNSFNLTFCSLIKTIHRYGCAVSLWRKDLPWKNNTYSTEKYPGPPGYFWTIPPRTQVLRARICKRLKGQCHKIFSWIITGINDTSWKICHRCHWHQWQTIGTTSDCWQLEGKNYLSAKSTAQSCPKEIMKTFLIEDFFHWPPMSTTPVVHLELRISPRIFKKIWNGPNGIIRGLGETDPRRKPEVENLVALSL